VRDFTYVTDTVEGLLTLAVAGVDSEAYNVSSGAYYSVTELAHKIIAALGLSHQTEVVYTGESWIGDAQRWEVSIEKISALWYRPRTSLDQGIEHTIAWFVDQEVSDEQ
jgi:nucleoside-diphosphate-sugar epimerase